MWRAVGGGREVLRQGLKWEFGDGETINFLRDPWVSSSPLRLWPNVLRFSIDYGEKNVKSFIKPERNWKQVNKIKATGPEVSHNICKVSIPLTFVVDRPRFLGNDLAEYSVSKAYKLLTAGSSIVLGTDWRWV